MTRLVEQTRKKKAGSVSEVTGHPKDAAPLSDDVAPGFLSVSKDNAYGENNLCNDGRTGRLHRFDRRAFNRWASDRPLAGNWQKITPTE
jgi:hypothetical protein